MEVYHPGLDRVRQRSTEVENHVIDEFLAGRLTRRDFLRRGTIVGFVTSGSRRGPRRMRVLEQQEHHRDQPWASKGRSHDSGRHPGARRRHRPDYHRRQGGQDMISQTGEYLCLADQQLVLRPVLATSWKPNADASAVTRSWTFPGSTSETHIGRYQARPNRACR